MRELGADIGLAFDGDADRLMAVDERGSLINGDQVMCICANHLKQQGRLRNNTLVTTIMSNMGLDLALKKLGIQNVKTRVGDRYVLENMLANNYSLGGEQSGHVIFLDYNTTGDGLITALQLLTVIVESKQSLSRLARIMEVLPQALYGAHVSDARKYDYDKDETILASIAALEKKYEGRGRVLVRASGTEPIVRVMIEGPDQHEMDQDVYDLAKLIERRLNG